MCYYLVAAVSAFDETGASFCNKTKEKIASTEEEDDTFIYYIYLHTLHDGYVDRSPGNHMWTLPRLSIYVPLQPQRASPKLQKTLSAAPQNIPPKIPVYPPPPKVHT